MAGFNFVFMADSQLGCFAGFSGLSDDEVARLATSDIHVAAVPTVEGFDWDLDRYQRALDAAVEFGAEFVIVGGDMVDDPSDAAQFEALIEATGRSRVPVHWVPGNHDAAEDTIVPTPSSLAAYRQRFGRDHYAFEHGNTAFVVVNSVIWDHPERLGDEFERQLEWLEEELTQARHRRVDHILVFGHHPLFTTDPDEDDTYWNIPSTRRRRLLGLLARHEVRAYFCGHWHRNGGGTVDGMEVAVTGAVGMPLGADPSGFRVVQVAPQRVEHRYVTLDDHAQVVG